MKINKNKVIMYFLGLFVIAVGAALSVKSDMGVSPVTTIPYTVTYIWGVDMGITTFLFHLLLVFIEFVLLRKNFKLKNLLQVAVGVVFGLFTSLCNYLVFLIPFPNTMLVRIMLLTLSIVAVALGLFFYVPAEIMPMAVEGLMLVISEVTGIKFSTIKIALDIAFSLISLIVCLIAVHNMGSVGTGTVVSAITTGLVLKVITRLFGKKRDMLLNEKA
ncbi:MAG: hypothetical protein HDT44_03600 [Ruminococcaceae bacterium]|nr:hypothetical protein [Oscillospiraceae bacterium]